MKKFSRKEVETSNDSWMREIETIKKVSHVSFLNFLYITQSLIGYQERIIQFMELNDDEIPGFVMKLAWESLLTHHEQATITDEETVLILHQGIQALEFLHSHKLEHRDVKPENFLVHSRKHFHLKLVSFGPAGYTSDSEAFCRSLQYAAPEIWEHDEYTSAAEIWSLGVVVYEFAYGLPRLTKDMNQYSWFKILRESIEYWDSEGLIDFLNSRMLQEEPQKRLSAESCGKAIIKLKGIPRSGKTALVKDNQSNSMFEWTRSTLDHPCTGTLGRADISLNGTARLVFKLQSRDQMHRLTLETSKI